MFLGVFCILGLWLGFVWVGVFGIVVGLFIGCCWVGHSVVVLFHFSFYFVVVLCLFGSGVLGFAGVG